MRVGVYARISDDPAGLGLGVGRQVDDCRALAKLRRWDVADTYVDNSVSAYKTKVVRPEFERMLADLGAAVIDGIVAYDLDRFARKPVDLERAISIYDRREGVFATVQGDIDLSSPDGRTMARVMVAFANKSSMDTSRRVRRKHLELAQKGIPVGGTRPFGFKADKVTIEPTEAELIRQAAASLMSGVGLHAICRSWNEQGITSTRGYPWSKPVLRNMMLSPRLAGYRVHHGTIARDTGGKAVRATEPILDDATWELLVAYLTDPARSGPHVHLGGRKYLLSGIIRCASCSVTMTGNADRQYATFHYSCRNPQCSRRAGINGPKADDLVTRLIVEYLGRKEVLPDVDPWAGETALAEAGAKIAALMNEYTDKGLSGDVVFPAVAKLEDQIARLRADRTTWLRGQVRQPANVLERWPSMDVEQRRAVIGSVLSAVVVRSAEGRRRFDPERLEAIFR